MKRVFALIAMALFSVGLTGCACGRGSMRQATTETTSYSVEKTAYAAEVMSQGNGFNCFTFDGSKSGSPEGTPITFLWNLGDGITSTDMVVNHCYEKAGLYTVTLTVKDADGKDCGPGVATVQVEATFPPMALRLSNLVVCVGDKVPFDATGSRYDGKAHWDFGDNAMSDDAKTEHVFTKPGTYTVTLSVTNAKGGVATSTSTVTVHGNPTAIITVN
jgi:surface-anchored protein